MNEILNYICVNLKRQDRNMWNIGRALRKQHRFNGGIVGMVFAIGAYAYLTNLHLREQECELEQLKAKLEEGAAMK